MVLIEAKTTSTAHSTREAMSLVCFFDRVRRSRHGWMMVLHARCGGMDVRRLVGHAISALQYIADVPVGVPEALYVPVR